MTPPSAIALPPRAALLLDLDGTLLDIAPTPDAVLVPPDLPSTLRRLRAQLDNAVAIITGRPIAQVDALLGDIPFAVAGEHGGAIRAAPRAVVMRAELPSVPQAWREAAETIAAARPGVLVEHKARGFVFHFRMAPHEGPELREAVETIMADRTTPAGAFVVLPALMAWEVKPHGADKGHAVKTLMALAPFAGRCPVYVGDDVTDEDGMAAARALGGLGLRVPDVFGDAAGVRAWLAALAGA